LAQLAAAHTLSLHSHFTASALALQHLQTSHSQVQFSQVQLSGVQPSTQVHFSLSQHFLTSSVWALLPPQEAITNAKTPTNPENIILFSFISFFILKCLNN
jgi:hypothetical protein